MGPKLLHFIYNLKRGGAETMLVSVINELTEYDHLIVTICEAVSYTHLDVYKRQVYCVLCIVYCVLCIVYCVLCKKIGMMLGY